jgi:hypothetical protein
MNLRKALLILLFSSLALPCNADFTLIPGVNLYMEYNDNINLDSDNEEDDVIARVSPNVTLDWQTPRLDVSLYAIITQEKYLDNTDNDRLGAEANQASTLSALARLYRDVFFLRVTNTYSRVPIDEGGRGGEGNTNINLTDSNILRINPYLQFPLIKNTQMTLGYIYTYQWYEEEEGDDYISHTYSARLSWAFAPRMSASLNGTHEKYRPRDPDEFECTWFGCPEDQGGTYDYDKDTISLGLSYQATDRLSLSGSYGHTWLDYDVKGKGDTDIYSATADYEITSNYSIGAEYNKSVGVSVDEGATKDTRYSAYLQYNDRFMLNFTIFVRNNEYVEINREDDSYGGSLSGELPFNEKTGITGLFRYTNFERSGIEDEEYDRYGTRFSLYYDTRLGRVSTGHIYNRTEYVRGGEDYDNNIIFISASLRF